MSCSSPGVRTSSRPLADRLAAEHGITATPIGSNLSDPGAPGALKAELDGAGIVVDVLINNAAFGTFGNRTGVTVTALCPGPTTSGFQARASMEDSKLVAGKKMPDPATVAADGFKAMMAGKPVYIQGFRNRLLALMIRFSPRAVVGPMVKRSQERVH